MSVVPHLCFHVVSIGGVLSRQASLPIQRLHILSRALSSHSSHHTSHTDDSYTLYSSTRRVLTHHNGLDRHPGSVRIRLKIRIRPLLQSMYTYNLTSRAHPSICGSKKLLYPSPREQHNLYFNPPLPHLDFSQVQSYVILGEPFILICIGRKGRDILTTKYFSVFRFG